MNRSQSSPGFIVFLSFLFLCVPAVANRLSAQDLPSNGGGVVDSGGKRVIALRDTGFEGTVSTSDCVSGRANDSWQLVLTQPRNVTISVSDVACPGDYFEVMVDGRKIGTTPRPSRWGCSFQGSPVSSGSFRTTLCPGTHTIQIRDAGFDRRSQSQIRSERMCPAGFRVSVRLAAPAPPPEEAEIQGLSAPSQETESLEMTPEAWALQSALSEIEPFVHTDAEGFQTLDVDKAVGLGVSLDTIEIAHRLVALNNRILAADQQGVSPELRREDFAFIEPLFLYQAKAGNPCGDLLNPTSCPARVEARRFFSTEQAVREHLVAQGFHRTANYAGGTSGRDYTRVVGYPGCSFTGAFRTQANYRQTGGCWTYSTQSPEPNPEYRSYRAPYIGWVAYAAWWHTFYC